MLTYLPAAYIRAELFISLQGKWALTNGDEVNITLFEGWGKGRGQREEFSLDLPGSISCQYFFFALPLCNICFVPLNNIPGTWWLLYYCTAMIKTTDNPLPLDFQPQQWRMGQILAGGSQEAAEGEDCEASAVPEGSWSSPAATLHLLHPELCPWPTEWSGLPRCSAWIGPPILLRRAQISLLAAVPTHQW